MQIDVRAGRIGRQLAAVNARKRVELGVARDILNSRQPGLDQTRLIPLDAAANASSSRRKAVR